MSKIPTLISLGILSLFICGCKNKYKGGKLIDGNNLEIGIKPPGEDMFSFNLLVYTSGLGVYGDKNTKMSVTNEVNETNTFFGVVSTTRNTKTYAEISPTLCEEDSSNTPTTANED